MRKLKAYLRLIETDVITRIIIKALKTIVIDISVITIETAAAFEVGIIPVEITTETEIVVVNSSRIRDLIDVVSVDR